MLGFFDRFRHGGARTLLSSYIDGEVSDSERRRVERHLSQCEECRHELESLSLTVSALRQLPEIQTTRSFAISRAPEPVSVSAGWVWGLRLAASAAAVVLVGLILADVTGLVVQSDLEYLEEWTSQSGRVESESPAAPAAPAPAMAPAPAAAAAQQQPAAPAPVQAMSAQAAAAPTQAPAAPAPAPTMAPAAAAAPAAAPAPTSPPIAAAMRSDPEPTSEPASNLAMVDSPAQAMASEETVGATSSLESAREVAEEPQTSTPTATPVPTATATLTPTPAPTATPTGTPTAVPTPTVTSTPTAVPSPTPTVTATASRLQADESAEPESRPAIPLVQLEIALGILLLILIGVALWKSRRSR